MELAEDQPFPFLHLPIELRMRIYTYALFPPPTQFHLRSMTYTPPPTSRSRIKGSPAVFARRIRSQAQNAALAQLGSSYVRHLRDPDGNEFPSAVQLRLVSLQVNAEASHLLYGGSCDGSDLRITVNSHFLTFLKQTVGYQSDRSARILRRDRARAESLGQSRPAQLELVRYIRRWRRLRFFIAESRLNDEDLEVLALLIRDHAPEDAPRPLLEPVLTGLDEIYWDYKDMEMCAAPRMNIGRGLRPAFSFYKLKFFASFVGCEVRGTYIALAMHDVLMRVSGREPPGYG